MGFAGFSIANRVAIALNTFQGDEKNIDDRVAKLVKMCGNRNRADEFIVGLYGAVWSGLFSLFCVSYKILKVCISLRIYMVISLSWPAF